ncbi:MAG TPA: dTDP-4-dehydrorhamnose reductase [Galbitalea sp.]|nr:dTDP-4-dehydrorhamnose reductase [Galbitalea sp.]
MLGTDLVAALSGRDVTALTRRDLDVSDRDAVAAAVAGYDTVINASAFTRVDDAETEEDAAYLVNASGVENLALASAAAGATLVSYSTDYVFDGTASSPYPEGAPTSPVTAYGRTKAEGERLALAANPGRTLILRTAYLYGQHGANFAATMLRLASAHPTVSVVTDQVGQPTWTADLAMQTLATLDAGVRSGILHATNSGQASWFDFARAIFEANGLDPERVLPTDSTSFVRPAPRPAYSVLGHDRWADVGIAPMRPWREALAAAVSSGAIGAP